jgi:hypothetical protein
VADVRAQRAPLRGKPEQRDDDGHSHGEPGRGPGLGGGDGGRAHAP